MASHDELWWQPLSDKSLSRFRRRCCEHESETGIDLMRDCIKALSARIAKLMGITQRVKRMDSMRKSGQCQLSFDRELCASCPHKDECKARIYKKVSSGYGLDRGHENAKQQRQMETASGSVACH